MTAANGPDIGTRGKPCQANAAGLGPNFGALFRPYGGVAAGAAGRRDHRHLAAVVGRRGADFGIDIRRRAQRAIGARELVAERLTAFADRRSVRFRAGAVWRHRRAVGGGQGRRRRRLRR